MKQRSVPYMVLTVIWLMVVWGHSMLSAETSTQESLGLLAVFQVWMPWLTHAILRKAAHFIEFAILGFLMTGYLGRKNGIAAPLFACLANAVVDESIQLYIEGRMSSIQDVWIDFCGALLGILIMWAGLALFTKKK